MAAILNAVQQMRQIEVDGQRTRLFEAGEGTPVVVLHGWGGRIESMAPVLECLQEGFRTLALDLPGFGEAPAPRATWGTDDYASFVRSVLAAVGVARTHLVAHSFGAKTSLCLAAADPASVDKLVLVGSSGLRRPPTIAARGKRAVSRAARVAGTLGPPGRALRAAVYERIASDDYKQAGEMRPILVRVVNEDLRELLPRVQAPTLLVWGSQDEAVPLAHARIMESLIPDAGLVVFEGAGHFAYLDEPQRFCHIVRHFFGARSA